MDLEDNYYKNIKKSKVGFIRMLEFGTGYIVINNLKKNKNWGTPETIRSLVRAAGKWA